MNKKQFRTFLTTFLNKKCLFILGSGASINYAKPIDATKELIKHEICTSSSFLAEINKNKNELNRLLILPASKLEIPDNILWLYRNTTSNEMLRTLYLKNILPDIPLRCPEYEIFNLCKAGAIFNFNHDGLATMFIRNKNIKILYPHGRFPAHAKPFLNSLDETEYDLNPDLFNIWAIHAPIKETEKILIEKPYLDIKENFSQFDEIFIIGYSFCETSAGNINDECTFNMLLSLVKFYKKRIWVINPNPERIINRIYENSKGRVEIIAMTLKWDYLVKAALDLWWTYRKIWYS